MTQRHMDLSDALMERVETLQLVLSAATGRKPSKSKLVTLLVHVGLDVVGQQSHPAEYFRSLAIAAKEKSPRGSDV